MSYDNNQSGGRDDDYKRDIRVDTPPESHGTPPHMHYPPPYHHHHTRRPNRFLLFVFSFLPGLSHIYLGLVRRGLFYISALALIIFFSAMIVPYISMLGVLTGFSIAGLYAVSFFEAFAIRRDIVMGKEVKDTIPNIAILRKNKYLLIVLIAVVAVTFGIRILSVLNWYVWIILGIVAICFIGTRAGSRRASGSKTDKDSDEQQ